MKVGETAVLPYLSQVAYLALHYKLMFLSWLWKAKENTAVNGQKSMSFLALQLRAEMTNWTCAEARKTLKKQQIPFCSGDSYYQRQVLPPTTSFKYEFSLNTFASGLETPISYPHEQT